MVKTDFHSTPEPWHESTELINALRAENKQNEIIVQIRKQDFKLSGTVKISAHKCHVCFSSSGNT